MSSILTNTNTSKNNKADTKPAPSLFNRLFIAIGLCIGYPVKHIRDFFIFIRDKLEPILRRLFSVKNIESIKKFLDIVNYINLIPGVLTLIGWIFLIIVMLWYYLRIIFTYMSIDIGELTFLYDKKTLQIIYSVFYLLVSFFLLFFLILHNISSSLDSTSPPKAELDMIDLGFYTIGSIHVLWSVTVIIIGSAIAKAFYKISCNGNNTNTNIFAKSVDSSVINILIITSIILILFKIPALKWGIDKYQAGSTDSITIYFKDAFNILLVYIILRLITLMFEEFAANNLVHLISSANPKIESPIKSYCFEEGIEETKEAALYEKIFQIGIGIVLWLILFAITIITVPPIPQLMDLRTNIYKRMANLLRMLTRKISGIITTKTVPIDTTKTSKTSPGSSKQNFMDTRSIASGLATKLGSVLKGENAGQEPVVGTALGTAPAPTPAITAKPAIQAALSITP